MCIKWTLDEQRNFPKKQECSAGGRMEGDSWGRTEDI